MRPDMPEDGARRLRGGLPARRQGHIGFGNREPDRVRTGHDGGFRDCLVLDQDALELEGADPIVRRLEHVVGAADEGDVALGVASGDIARPVMAAGHYSRASLRIVLIAGHQAMRPLAEIDRDLPLVAVSALGVEESDAIAGQRPADVPGLEPLAWRIADQGRRFRLAIAVADIDVPGSPDSLDDLGVERLAGARGRPQPHRARFQILLDQKAPDGGRRADVVTPCRAIMPSVSLALKRAQA